MNKLMFYLSVITTLLFLLVVGIIYQQNRIITSVQRIDKILSLEIEEIGLDAIEKTELEPINDL